MHSSVGNERECCGKFEAEDVRFVVGNINDGGNTNSNGGVVVAVSLAMCDDCIIGALLTYR